MLALVLSVLSVGAFASNAKMTYTDEADFTYGAEAVDVLTGLGVLNGMGEGAFEPAGDFTRAQAAKIVTYLVAGTTVADSLEDKASGFNDDDTWSAKYVRFASERGIVVGYGDGNFGPGDTLTRDQWLKMLLTAVGYNDEACGLVGPYWAENTRDLAVTSGLIGEGDLGLPFNRETAAYYAFLALTKNFKDVYYTKTTELGTVSYKADLGSDDNLLTKNWKNLSFVYEDDLFMRPVGKVYSLGRAWVATIATYDKVYENHVAVVPGTVLTDDLGLSAAQYKAAQVTIYEDGAATEYAVTDKIGGNGTIVEVYKSKENPNDYRFVLINTYVDKLAVVEAATKTDVAYIEVTDYVNEAALRVDTDEFALGDVVLYNVSYKADPVAVNVRLADSVNGRVDTIDVRAQTFAFEDGTDFENGKQSLIFADQNLINKRTYAIYVDEFGYAMYSDLVRFSTENVYVLGMRARATYKASDENLFEADADALAQAMVIDLETGEVKVVNIKTVSYLGGYYYSDVNGEPSKLSVVPVNLDVKNMSLPDGTILTNRNQMYIPVVNGGSELNNRGFYQMTTIGDEVVFTKKYNTFTVTTEAKNPVIELASNEAAAVKARDDESVVFDDNVHTDSMTVIKNVVYYPDGSSEVKISTLTGYEEFVNAKYDNAMVAYEEADGAGYKIVHEVVNVSFASAPRTVGFFIGKNIEGGTDGIPETSIDRDIYYFVVNGKIIGRYANDYSIYGEGEDVYGEYEATDMTTLDALAEQIDPEGIDYPKGYLVSFIDYADVWTVYDVQELEELYTGVIIDSHQSEYIVLQDDTIIKLNGKTILDEDGYPTTVKVGDEISVYPGVIINHGPFLVNVVYEVDGEEYKTEQKTLGTYNVIDAPEVEEYQVFDGWYDEDGAEATEYTIVYDDWKDVDEDARVITFTGTIGTAEGWYALTLNIQNNANEPTEKAKFDKTVIYVQENTPLTDPFSQFAEIKNALAEGYAYKWFEEYDETAGTFSTEFTFDETTVMDDNITLYCRFVNAEAGE